MKQAINKVNSYFKICMFLHFQMAETAEDWSDTKN